jgi:hypothetical protein
MRIAFGYKAGSGKSTAADYLVQKKTGENLSFAASIYKIARKAQKIASFPEEKDRDLLQKIGMWGRNRDPNVWVNTVRDRILEYPGNLFISDLRFPNEFDMLRENGFVLVKIVRSDRDESGHISETNLDEKNDSEWDHIIQNDGTLQNLYEKLEELTKSMGTHV